MTESAATNRATTDAEDWMFGLGRKASDSFVAAKFSRVAIKDGIAFGYCLGRPALMTDRETLGVILQPIEDLDEFFRSFIPSTYDGNAKSKATEYDGQLMALCQDLVATRLLLAVGRTMKNSIRLPHLTGDDGSIIPTQGYKTSLRCGGTRDDAGFSTDLAMWQQFAFLVANLASLAGRLYGTPMDDWHGKDGQRFCEISYSLTVLALHDPNTQANRVAFDKSRA